MIRFSAQAVTIDAAAGDDTTEPRTISGIAVPYGVEATVSDGQRVIIAAGAVPTDGRPPRLVFEHDTSRVLGVVTARESTDDGMLFTAKIAATAAGDELLALLEMGAYDSVSVGLAPLEAEPNDDGALVVTAADWQELSVVFNPAFSAAKIDRVAATAATETPTIESENPTMTDTIESAPPAEIPTVTPVYATARRPELPTAAEWIAASLVGGDTFHRMTELVRAAAPDVVTTDIPGALPTPIVQPIYNNMSGRRPVVDAVGVRAMPAAGKTFVRPSVGTHNSVAVQSAENAALQSSTFVVSENTVTKAAYGGTCTVSEQTIDWSDPAIIAPLLDDMARVYGNATDNVAADALLAGVTQSAILTDPTSASEWVSDIYDAASTILTNSNGGYASHLFLSPNMWAALGKLVDSTGRPLFPQVGPMNAMGQVSPAATGGNAFGLQVVVDRNFAADTVIVGDPSGFEIYEQVKGALSVDVPSTMSRTIAFRGYFATLMIDATKFVKLT